MEFHQKILKIERFKGSLKLKNNDLFIEIYNSTYDDVYKYIILKCSNTFEASDILQNVYFKFYKQLIKEKKIDKYRDYIFKIAKNEVNRHYALKLKKEDELSFSEFEEYDEIDLIGYLDEEALIDTKLDTKAIWEYLKGLDEITFKVFVLYFQLDEKIKDIARSLDLSESNVKNRLYRTLKNLKEKFNL